MSAVICTSTSVDTDGNNGRSLPDSGRTVAPPKPDQNGSTTPPPDAQ